MADSPDKESKTEPASEKKKRDSIEKGQTPSSKEALVFASLLGMLIVGGLLISDGVVRLTINLQRLIEDPGGWSLESGDDAVLLFRAIALEAGSFLLPLVLVLGLSSVAASVLQNPPSLVLERIKPKLSKLSLSSGVTRIFGAQGQIEFLKSVLKFGTIALVAIVLLGADYRTVTESMFGDPSAIPELMLVISIRLLAAVSVATVILVAADLVWSRLQWERDLRMTRQEVKDEHKQAEGDPIQKARRLSLARDRSRKRMIAAVPTATLVVANPTHYAIAMRYVREEGGAPVVVAKGKDLIALKIRGVAEAHDIPVVEDKALARSLYDAVEIDRMIPAEFYRAVAEILHFLSAGKQNGTKSQ